MYTKSIAKMQTLQCRYKTKMHKHCTICTQIYEIYYNCFFFLQGFSSKCWHMQCQPLSVLFQFMTKHCKGILKPETLQELEKMGVLTSSATQRKLSKGNIEEQMDEMLFCLSSLQELYEALNRADCQQLVKIKAFTEGNNTAEIPNGRSTFTTYQMLKVGFIRIGFC